MIDYSQFKNLDASDVGIRLEVYNKAIQVLKRFPKGSMGLCAAMFFACCEISYSRSLTDNELSCVDPHKVAKVFYVPAFHMDMYPEIYKYKPEKYWSCYWYPVADRGIRLKKLRMAINSANTKLNKAKKC